MCVSRGRSAPPLAGPEPERVRTPSPHGEAHPWLICSKVRETPFLDSLPFLKFATNEAIQRTEAYEYAQSLGAQSDPLPDFQVSCSWGPRADQSLPRQGGGALR